MMKQLHDDKILKNTIATVMSTAPKGDKPLNRLSSTWLDSPLGLMLAISDDKALLLLEFIEKRQLTREIEKLKRHFNAIITPNETAPIKSIKEELAIYFTGQLKTFKTPIQMTGSPFQQTVWQALMDIPYGETRSYGQQAVLLKKPTAFRAVANANGANQLSVIIPCHRVINTNGKLGGYSGGLDKKQWLLKLESKRN